MQEEKKPTNQEIARQEQNVRNPSDNYTLQLKDGILRIYNGSLIATIENSQPAFLERIVQGHPDENKIDELARAFLRVDNHFLNEREERARLPIQNLFYELSRTRAQFQIYATRILNGDIAPETIQKMCQWYDKINPIVSKIYEENEGLLKNFFGRRKNHFSDTDELYLMLNMHFLRAIRSFDCTRKIQFSTYAYHAMQSAQSRLIALTKRQLPTIGEVKDFNLPTQDPESPSETEEEIQRILDIARKNLTEKEMHALLSHVGLIPFRNKDIAEGEGVSPQAVNQRARLGLKKLIENLPELQQP